MTVQLYDTTQAIAPLEDEWNELAAGHPLRGYDWLAGWFDIYGQGSRLYVLGVRDDSGRLIGLAPWRIEESIQRGAEIRSLGDGEVCTDHTTVLARPGFEQQVVDQVADYLASDQDNWDLLRLEDAGADDRTLALLSETLADREFHVQQREADACWQIDLPEDWEAFLAQQSKSHRKQLRRAERRVLESDRCQWHLVQTPAELEVAWPILIDLHQRRRKSLNEPGCFASERFTEFHTILSHKLLEHGQLRLSYITLDDQPAAAEYHFASPNAIHAYQGGVDPDLLEQEPGRLSLIATIQHAMNEGHWTFDLMRGDEPYKAHWRATLKGTVHYRIVPPRTTAKLRAGATNVMGALKSGARLLTR